MNDGKAKRLVLERGQWTLEIEKLAALRGALFRPRSQGVEGEEFILEWLKQHQPNLALQASHILADSHSDSDEIAFAAQEQAWSPAPFAPPPGSSLAAQSDGSQEQPSQASVDALIQRITLLEAQLRRLPKLESRLLSLEQKLQNSAHLSPAKNPLGAAPPATGSPAFAGPSAKSAPASPAPEGPASGEEVTQIQAQAPRPEAESKGAKPPKTPDKAAAPKAQDPDPLAKPDRLTVPAAEALQDTLTALLGTELALSTVTKRPLPALNTLNGPCYICQIIDDNGEIEGLILSDLEATVRFGGTLMMTPADEMANQIINAEPSEDVVDAAAEIFNNLSGTLNAVEGNKHIKVDTGRPLVESDHPWLQEPVARQDFTVREGGVLSFILQ